MCRIRISSLNNRQVTELLRVQLAHRVRSRKRNAAARIVTFMRFVATRKRALARGPGIRSLVPLLVELAAEVRERDVGGSLRVQAARVTVERIFARLASLQSRAAGKVPWREVSELLEPEGSSTRVDVKTRHIYELSALFDDISALLQGSKHCIGNCASADEALYWQYPWLCI